jgi:hypothetical protein
MTPRRLGAILAGITAGLAIVAAVIGAIEPRHPADQRRPEPAAHWSEGRKRIGEGLDGLGPSIDGAGCTECHDHPTPGPAPRRPSPLPRAAVTAVLRSL